MIFQTLIAGIYSKIFVLQCSESPEDHTECIWKNFIQKAKAKNIAVVAHSYGGICTLELVCNDT